MPGEQVNLESLAAKAVELSGLITSSMKSQGFKIPSLAPDCPNYPQNPEIQGPRMMLLATLWDMLYLTMGPLEVATLSPAFVAWDGIVLDVMNQFDFYSAVPTNGSASYSDIAKSTKLPESIVRRVLSYAMTIRMFQEAEPGSDRIIHTPATIQIAESPLMRSFTGHFLEEIRRAGLETPLSLQKFSSGKTEPSQEVLEAGLSLADLGQTGKPQSIWDYFEQNSFAAKRFSEAMQVASKFSFLRIEDVLQAGFDWASLGQATVIDVGGSSGHEAVFLAQKFPDLTLIVQDRPEIEEYFNDYVPEDLKSRISFDRHDFFQPQNLKADLFFLKMILHDWPDKYCVKILRNLLPALKEGGRIIICDNVTLPQRYDEDGKPLVPVFVQRMQAGADLTMLSAFNSKERTIDDWEKLLKQTNERMKFEKVTILPGALWSVLVVKLDG